MKEAKDGMIRIDGETLIEFQGFLIDGEVLLSDSDRMGDYEKIKVKVTPSMIEFWINENRRKLEEIAGVSIF